jgi:hypothetical protein
MIITFGASCNIPTCYLFTASAQWPCAECSDMAEGIEPEDDIEVVEDSYRQCQSYDCYNEVTDLSNTICHECQYRLEANENKSKADYYRSALVSILHSIGPKQDDNTDDWIDDLIPTITAISQDATYWHNKYIKAIDPEIEDRFELIIKID